MKRPQRQSELVLCLAVVAMTIAVLAKYDYPSASQTAKTCKHFSTMCEASRLQLSSFSFTIIACILALALAARDLEAPREVRQHREREREHARILVVCARRLRLCSVHGRCHRVQRARVTQLPCTVARERECRECTQQKEFQLCIAPVCARAIRGMHAVECSKHGACSAACVGCVAHVVVAREHV